MKVRIQPSTQLANLCPRSPADNIDTEPQAYYLARHIYNTLTAIYSALYRTTSPLTLDWREEEVARLLGNDPVLIKSFCNIKTELFWFRKSRPREVLK